MKKIIIVTSSFLNSETGSLGLGGVETYMYNLSLACQESSYDVIVCQLVSSSVSKEYNIHGILCKCIPSSIIRKVLIVSIKCIMIMIQSLLLVQIRWI